MAIFTALTSKGDKTKKFLLRLLLFTLNHRANGFTTRAGAPHWIRINSYFWKRKKEGKITFPSFNCANHLVPRFRRSLKNNRKVSLDARYLTLINTGWGRTLKMRRPWNMWRRNLIPQFEPNGLFQDCFEDNCCQGKLLEPDHFGYSTGHTFSCWRSKNTLETKVKPHLFILRLTNWCRTCNHSRWWKTMFVGLSNTASKLDPHWQYSPCLN